MAASSKAHYARGFAADARTERALRAGLAGRDAKVQRGRLEIALRTLAAEPASSLVFVDLDGNSDPETAAGRLTEVCPFETAVVAIGSTDSARFGHALLQQGMADYLVKPLSAAVVREAVAALSGEAPEHLYAGDVIAFAGSPGSGVSTLVAAVAHAAAADGRTASVVDLDPVCGKLSARLGVEPGDGLRPLLASIGAGAADDPDPHIDPDRIDEISTPAASGISLIAYPRTEALPESADAAALSALFRHLANRTHLVLATGMPDPETQLLLMRDADARVLVYEPTIASVGAVVRRLARLGTDRPATLVQCSTRGRRYTLSPAHVRYALGDRRPDVVLPFDPALHAAATGKPSGRPGKAYRKALRQAIELVGEGHRS